MEKFMEHTQAQDGSQGEQHRLEGQHETIVYHMGKPVYAPVDFSKPGLKILDSGCANGRWLKDLRASSPAKHEYYGTDIDDSLYPNPAPEGMHFQDASIKDDFPAEWKNKFDLIHERFVMGAAAPKTPESVVVKLAEMLKPGGWLQLVELDNREDPDNAPMMEQMKRMLRVMFTEIGIGANFAQDLKGLMEKAGLVDVQEKKVDVANGETIKQKSLKEKSIVSPVAAVAPVTNVLKSLPNNSLTEEELEGFDGRLRKELEERGAWMKVWIIWGRKPE